MDLEDSFSLLSGWYSGKNKKQKLFLDRINPSSLKLRRGKPGLT
jgi:hypothetical protein